VSASSFVLFLAVGAALLAMWVEARFPSLGPTEWRRIAAHLVGAFLVIHLGMPWLGEVVRSSGVPAPAPVTALAVALPAITYLFLASLWILKRTQGLMSGLR
jgi:hypothetical protein